MRTTLAIILVGCCCLPLAAREIHVAPNGDDEGAGTVAAPLRTIGAAARQAQSGDTVTVHAGVYREEIAPPRGGTSDSERIVYRAAPGERVVIKGSERIRGWRHVAHDTWRVDLPNTLFGDFNPYADEIHGDWFNPRGRKHHTGAVYLNGHWLVEAARLEDVLAPAGTVATATPSADVLLNVAWLRPVGPRGTRVAADAFDAQAGVQTAPCSEGGRCIGWLNHGDWVSYPAVDLSDAKAVALRVASATTGGTIELRLDGPTGRLLGRAEVKHTGGWQSWTTVRAQISPPAGKHELCLVFRAPVSDGDHTPLWFARVDADTTTIWAQFPDINPNETEVEINVRRTVFYPDHPFVNFITIRGFTLRHAATPWAPPTAEQPGLIGTHWSRGWVIEDNDIGYSTCVGVALGKYGDEFDNTSQNTATGYVDTIHRALANRWSREHIGGHVVRNNHIHHCEQAGVVGSLGAIFCTITGNHIHDIHVRRLFTGAEMAGIKLHAAIDTVIARNHIHHCTRGIWLDWMAQGTHVTRNLLHDNGPSEDLFMEVDHGPFLIDHNLLLSDRSLLDVSEGGAYAHNLFAGRIVVHPELRRETPYHPAHTTALAGLAKTEGGDNRFCNNVFIAPASLAPYDEATRPLVLAGNVFLKGAAPCRHEATPLVSSADPAPSLTRDGDTWQLALTWDRAWSRPATARLVTTVRLGRAAVPDLPYVQADDSPYRLDSDYHGKARNPQAPCPGPFAWSTGGEQRLRVWP